MSTQMHESDGQHAGQEPVKQDTIFYDVADMSGYDKNLRTARIYLYIVAALQILFGIVQYFQLLDYSQQTALLSGGITAGIGLIFIILAVWSYKKPATAFLTALIFFIAVHVISAILDPSTIIQGIFLKVLVIIALIKGYKDAREYEEMKLSLGATIIE